MPLHITGQISFSKVGVNIKIIGNKKNPLIKDPKHYFCFPDHEHQRPASSHP